MMRESIYEAGCMKQGNVRITKMLGKIDSTFELVDP